MKSMRIIVFLNPLFYLFLPFIIGPNVGRVAEGTAVSSHRMKAASADNFATARVITPAAIIHRQYLHTNGAVLSRWWLCK